VAERVISGRYRIVRHLARGGMAEVYLGQDELLARPVAVKVLFPELAADESFVERFRREARAAAGLNHHNIVSVYDFGEDDGVWFIVMEYVDGRTLRDIIRADGPMEPAGAIQIGAEIAAALAAAHAQGIVHRDVKPANVLIAGETVKVTDFGIARAANARQGLTMPGTVIGTATYLSPEQARGGAVDGRSDLYSLGMVVYEMLTGRPPFAGDSPIAIATKQLSETPPMPSTANPRVPRALDAVVMRAMSIEPGDRQPTADDLRAQLLAAAPATGDPDATMAIPAPTVRPVEETAVVRSGPSTTMLPPVTAGPPSRRLDADVYRRRRAVVIAAVALVALGVIALLALLNSGGKSGTVPVPQVVGFVVADARSALERAGLKSKVVEEDRPGAAADRVADQNPRAGAVVRSGATVSLMVPRAATASTLPVATTTQTTVAVTSTAPATTPITQAPATTAPTTTSRPTTTVVATTAPTTTRP